MKVLICGEYGIYCRELISRLKKEKHDIFVITGSEKARREKPRSGVFQEYNFSYRSKNIGTIMKNVQADVLLIMGICDTKFTWQDINPVSYTHLLGETISYRITVTNDGNIPVENIRVEDSLVSITENIITSLAPGESREFTYEYTVTEADIRNGQVDVYKRQM